MADNGANGANTPSDPGVQENAITDAGADTQVTVPGTEPAPSHNPSPAEPTDEVGEEDLEADVDQDQGAGDTQNMVAHTTEHV